MRIRVSLWLAAAFLLGAAIPLLAHHSFAAQFDATKHVSFKGIVTKLEWMNPHVWFYVDALNEKGETIHWECEAGNPNALARNGWKKSSLSVGDTVSVEGSLAKCCSSEMTARSIVTADGRRIFAASSGEGIAVPNRPQP